MLDLILKRLYAHKTSNFTMEASWWWWRGRHVTVLCHSCQNKIEFPKKKCQRFISTR